MFLSLQNHIPGSIGTGPGLASGLTHQSFLGLICSLRRLESDPGVVCSEGYQAHGNSQGADASEEET